MAIDVYLADWLSLILRWAHIITGIAWIGSSFYFIWLDARLNVPPRDPETSRSRGRPVGGPRRRLLSRAEVQGCPAQLPEPLHWFKWEAYFTWMTGFALFIVVYYLNAEAMLIDPAVLPISPAEAAIISVALLLAGWLLYDGVCRLDLGEHHLRGAGQCHAAGTLLGRESPLHRSRCLHADRRHAGHDHGGQRALHHHSIAETTGGGEAAGASSRTRDSARAPSNARCTTTT